MTNHSDIRLSPDIKFHLVRKIECHKVIGLSGTELLEHEAKYLEFHRLSGVILFDRNIESFPQVRELVEQVDERLSHDGRAALIMVDHEGDFVSELKRLIGVPPSAMAIGATGDPSFARDVACETGQAMRKLGVNVVLAPVADCYIDRACSVTGLRTFGTDPERVARFVCETIRGFREAGVLTCVKHFPGHGSTGEDSHEVLPKITKSLEELKKSDLVPFERSVEAGADMMMMAHVGFSLGGPGDDVIPASFDKRIIRGVLRGELEFDGVVITDALEMEGARAHVRATTRQVNNSASNASQAGAGFTGGFERSILAGSDLLLYSSPVPERMTIQGNGEPMIAIEVMQTIIDTLERIVDRNRIDKKLKEAAQEHEGVRNLLEILDTSEARINRLRERAGKTEPPSKTTPDNNVISLHDYALVPGIYKTAAERSVVLLRDPSSFIPVGEDRKCVLLPIEFVPGESLKRQDLSSFIGALTRNFSGWEALGTVVDFERDEDGEIRPLFATPEREWQGERQDGRKTAASGELFNLPEEALLLPVLSARGVPPEEFVEALTEFVDRHGAPFVLVTGWPLVEWVPEFVGCLVTFGASPQVAAAVSAVLSGEVKAQGVLERVL